MAIRVLQTSTPSEGTTGGTSIASNSITVLPGSFLHVTITFEFDAAQDVSTITDTQGNLPQTIFGTIPDATNSQKFAHAVLGPTNGGPIVVTANFSGAAVSYREITVREIVESSGYDAVNVAHHEQLQTAPTTGTDLTTSGNTGATTYKYGLISGACIETGGSGTPAVGTGFTSDGTAGTWNIGHALIRFESKRITAAGVQAATFTAAANDSHITVAVVFIEKTFSNVPRKIRPGHRGPHRVRQFPQSKSDTTNIAVPSVSGTVDITNSDDTLSADGTTGIVGTSSTTNANDTLAASGTAAVSGTLAKTNADDTLASAGTTTILGTLAKTNANDTLAANGTTTVTGSLAVTNADDTLSASGSVTASVLEGSRRASASNRPGRGPFNLKKFSRTRQNIDVVLQAIFGSLAASNSDDTLAASGTTTITGSLAKTNTNDTLAASGSPIVNGSLDKTNSNDNLSASGSPVVNGSLAKTNANDTLAASGSVGNAVYGTLAVTNASDTLSSVGSTTVLGTLAKTNSNDTLSGSGTVKIIGTLDKTNSNDSISASGYTVIIGTLTKTNNNDSLSANGSSGVALVRDTINLNLKFDDSISKSIKFTSSSISQDLEFDDALTQSHRFAPSTINKNLKFEENN